MKKLVFLMVSVLSLFSLAYGYYEYKKPVQSETPCQSCSLSDSYGSCSVSCSGSQKPVCTPGYSSGVQGFGNGVTRHPPSCACK